MILLTVLFRLFVAGWFSLLSSNSDLRAVHASSMSSPENDSLSIVPPLDLTYCKTYEKRLIAPDFKALYTASFDLDGARIYFSEGYAKGDDQLGMLNNPTNLQTGFETATGVFSIRGNAPIETYEQIIRSIQYFNTNSLTPIRDKQITIVLGNKLYNPENGHYYTLVQNQNAISWIAAKDQASRDNYLGLGGYLVTITSKQENDFIKALIASNSWLGGSDSAEEGVWRWVTGCEGEMDSGAGVYFSRQNVPNAGLSVNNNYNNWACTEPNDCCEGEDYLHMIGPEYEYCGFFGEWNDLPLNDGTVRSYIIEYGCGESLEQFKPWTTLRIFRTPPVYGSIEATACDTFSWKGNLYTKSGSYYYPSTSAAGCDSLTELQLTLFDSQIAELRDTSDQAYFWEATGLTYDKSGLYEAYTTASNGCDSTTHLQLEIIKPNDYFIPNVFSPNADGHNDYFTIYGNENLLAISWIKVFDRWGNLVFSRTDLPPNQSEAGWGGNIEVGAGTYLFAAQLQFKDGTSKKVTGSILLVR